MQKQKERSSSKSKLRYSDWNIIDENAKSNFIGYDKLKSEMNLIRFREVEIENGMNFHLVFDNTPFYAESGGQIGDTGSIESTSEEVIKIIDTMVKTGIATDCIPVAKPDIKTVAEPVSPSLAIFSTGLPPV